MDLGVYRLAAWSVVDPDGRVLADGEVDGLHLRHVQRALERDRRVRLLAAVSAVVLGLQLAQLTVLVRLMVSSS